MKAEEATARKVKNEYIFLDQEKFRNRLQIGESLVSKLMNHSSLADVVQSAKPSGGILIFSGNCLAEANLRGKQSN